MDEKTKRIKFPPKVRQYVFERDGYQCKSCGKTNLEARLEVDHIIAIAMGGTNDLSNLQTLCQRCNRQKNHHRDHRFDRQFTD